MKEFELIQAAIQMGANKGVYNTLEIYALEAALNKVKAELDKTGNEVKAKLENTTQNEQQPKGNS